MSNTDLDSFNSWLVAIGNATIGFCTFGFYRCFSVFYLPLMQEFGVNYSQVTLISGLYCFGIGFGSLIIPYFANTFGYRKLTLLFGLVYGSCYVVLSMVKQIILVQIFGGFLGGVCCGILFYTSMITSSLYFSKYKSIATGMATVGISIGGFSLPPLANYLIERYSWRGAILILSGVLFNTCVSASLYTGSKRFITKQVAKSDGSSQKQFNVNKLWTSIKEKADLGIFKDATYNIALVSSIGYSCGYISASTFIVPFANTQLQATPMKSALSLTIINILEIVSRIFSGFLADKQCINRSLFLFATSFIFASILIMVPFIQSIETLYVVCCFYGLTACPYQTIISVVYYEIVGKTRISQALGYQGFLVNTLLGPNLWFFGFLLDYTGSIRVPFFVCSAFIYLASFCMIVIWIRMRKNTKR